MQIALAFFHDFLVQIAYSFSVLSTNNIFFSWCLTSDSQTTQSHQTFLLDSSSQWWHLLSYNITLFLGFNIIVCVIGKLGINSKYHFFFFFFSKITSETIKGYWNNKTDSMKFHVIQFSFQHKLSFFWSSLSI